MDTSGNDLWGSMAALKSTSFAPSQFVWAKHSIADGMLTTTARGSDAFHNPTRRLLESIDTVDSVVLTHSAFGGAGSCLSYSIPELLLDEFKVRSPVMLYSVVNTGDSADRSWTPGDFELSKPSFELTPLQRYVQCHNVASQHINRGSDCTVLVENDWITADYGAIASHTDAIAALLRPSGMEAIDMSLENFSNLDPNDTRDEGTGRYYWNVSSILRHYVDPRPLPLHFGELRSYCDRPSFVQDIAASHALSTHSAVQRRGGYRRWTPYIGAIRSSISVASKWGEALFPERKHLTSWTFHGVGQGIARATMRDSRADRVTCLLHSIGTVDSLIRPVHDSCASLCKLSRNLPFGHHFHSNDACIGPYDIFESVNHIANELETYDNVIETVGTTDMDFTSEYATGDGDTNDLLAIALDANRIVDSTSDLDADDGIANTFTIPLKEVYTTGLQAYVDMIRDGYLLMTIFVLYWSGSDRQRFEGKVTTGAAKSASQSSSASGLSLARQVNVVGKNEVNPQIAALWKLFDSQTGDSGIIRVPVIKASSASNKVSLFVPFTFLSEVTPVFASQLSSVMQDTKVLWTEFVLNFTQGSSQDVKASAAVVEDLLRAYNGVGSAPVIPPVLPTMAQCKQISGNRQLNSITKRPQGIGHVYANATLLDYVRQCSRKQGAALQDNFDTFQQTAVSVGNCCRALITSDYSLCQLSPQFLMVNLSRNAAVGERGASRQIEKMYCLDTTCIRKLGHNLTPSEMKGLFSLYHMFPFPPEYTEALLRACNGFTPPAVTERALANEPATVWYMGILMLYLYCSTLPDELFLASVRACDNDAGDDKSIRLKHKISAPTVTELTAPTFTPLQPKNMIGPIMLCRNIPLHKLESSLIRSNTLDGTAVLLLQQSTWNVAKVVKFDLQCTYLVRVDNTLLSLPLHRIRHCGPAKPTFETVSHSFRSNANGGLSLQCGMDHMSLTSGGTTMSSPLCVLEKLDGKFLFGKDAEESILLASFQYQRLFYDILNLCGLEYSDNLISRYPFLTRPSAHDNAQDVFQVVRRGKLKRLSACDLLASAIRIASREVAAKGPCRMQQVIVAVPPHVLLAPVQLQAVLSSVQSCGLRVLGIVDDRLAALLSHGLISNNAALHTAKYVSPLLSRGSPSPPDARAAVEPVLVINCAATSLNLSLFDCRDMSNAVVIGESSSQGYGEAAVVDALLLWFTQQISERSGKSALLLAELKKPRRMQKIRLQCQRLARDIITRKHGSVLLHVAEKQARFVARITKYEYFDCCKNVYANWKSHITSLLSKIPQRQGKHNLDVVFTGHFVKCLPGVLSTVDAAYRQTLDLPPREDSTLGLYSTESILPVGTSISTFGRLALHVNYSQDPSLHDNVSSGAYQLSRALVAVAELPYDHVYTLLSEEAKLACAAAALRREQAQGPWDDLSTTYAVLLKLNYKNLLSVRTMTELSTLLRDGADSTVELVSSVERIGRMHISNMKLSLVQSEADLARNLGVIEETWRQVKEQRAMSSADNNASDTSSTRVPFAKKQTVMVFIPDKETTRPAGRRWMGEWSLGVLEGCDKTPTVEVIPDAWSQSSDDCILSTVDVSSLALYPHPIPPDSAFSLDDDEDADGNASGAAALRLVAAKKEKLAKFNNSKFPERVQGYYRDVHRFCMQLRDEKNSYVLPLHFTSGLPQLLAGMLHPNPAERLSMEVVLTSIRSLALRPDCSLVLDRIADLEGRVTGVEADIASVKRQVDSQQLLLEAMFMKAHEYPRLVLVVPDVDSPESFTEIFGSAKKEILKASMGITGRLLSGAKVSMNILSKATNFSPKKLLQQNFRVYTICEFTYQVVPTDITLSQPKEWFVRAAPFIKAGLLAAKVAGAVTGMPVGGITNAIGDRVNEALGNGEVGGTVGNMMSQTTLVYDSLVLFLAHVETAASIVANAKAWAAAQTSAKPLIAAIPGMLSTVFEVLPVDYDELNSDGLQAIIESLNDISLALSNLFLSPHDLYGTIGSAFIRNNVDSYLTSEVLRKSVDPDAEDGSKHTRAQRFTLAMAAAANKQYDESTSQLLRIGDSLMSVSHYHRLDTPLPLERHGGASDPVAIVNTEADDMVRVLNALAAVAVDNGDKSAALKYRLRAVIIERYATWADNIQYIENMFEHCMFMIETMGQLGESGDLTDLQNCMGYFLQSLRPPPQSQPAATAKTPVSREHKATMLSMVSACCKLLNTAEGGECCYAILEYLEDQLRVAVATKINVDRVLLSKACADALFDTVEVIYMYDNTTLCVSLAQPTLTGTILGAI